MPRSAGDTADGVYSDDWYRMAGISVENQPLVGGRGTDVAATPLPTLPVLGGIQSSLLIEMPGERFYRVKDAARARGVARGGALGRAGSGGSE